MGIVFRELPELLRAYVATQVKNYSRDGSLMPPGDLDTVDVPSLAMRTYLRVAALHPGRAGRAVSEIEALLELGPVDEVFEALDDAGVTPESLRSSDGKDPDEFFELMLPHLRKFIAAGEQVQEVIPESSWEWRERYEAIGRLMSGGFHQDCLHFFPDRDAVIDGYFVGEQPEFVRDMLKDIDALRSLVPADDDLEWALRGMGCGLLAPRGMTYWQWMDHIEGHLRSKLREWSRGQ
ncbi:contact-dependent growth inhibition system immunity protein [Streptomyces kanamyceticus]|uniref:CdiI immunity protein domain-containing protein n=1 Tax=Streptomyces kanamyceticus TaxID=1967 RepID=A0A5J6GI07_STRKN|nr:contact-dependent growth inhibition system immunity protein [Streptomyces kanamyceticus]QEU94052.1 hypothetical protein CP970_26925 [Streptomyces kanamyceticus]